MATSGESELFAEITQLQESKGIDDSEDEIKKLYNKYATAYEEIVINEGCVVDRTATEVFHRHLGPGKENVRILDAGCGTGMIAEHLRDLGYTNIDGLDVTQEMLDIAIKKGVYKKTYCAPLSKNHRLPISDGEYDCLIAVAAIAISHVKADAFDEIIRLVKPGGIICFTLRKDVSADPKFGYLPKFAELVKEKKWTLISEELVGYYTNTCDDRYNKCALLVYKVL